MENPSADPLRSLKLADPKTADQLLREICSIDFHSRYTQTVDAATGRQSWARRAGSRDAGLLAWAVRHDSPVAAEAYLAFLDAEQLGLLDPADGPADADADAAPDVVAAELLGALRACCLDARFAQKAALATLLARRLHRYDLPAHHHHHRHQHQHHHHLADALFAHDAFLPAVRAWLARRGCAPADVGRALRAALCAGGGGRRRRLHAFDGRNVRMLQWLLQCAPGGSEASLRRGDLLRLALRHGRGARVVAVLLGAGVEANVCGGGGGGGDDGDQVGIGEGRGPVAALDQAVVNDDRASFVLLVRAGACWSHLPGVLGAEELKRARTWCWEEFGFRPKFDKIYEGAVEQHVRELEYIDKATGEEVTVRMIQGQCLADIKHRRLRALMSKIRKVNMVNDCSTSWLY